jgi:hypothetical protein
MHICPKHSRWLICSEALPDKAQTTPHKAIPPSAAGRDFYYPILISKKSKIFYNFNLDNIFAQP